MPRSIVAAGLFAALLSAAPRAAALNVEVSGSVDWYIEHNFNRPDRYIADESGERVLNPVQNALRNFDFKDDQIALNLAEVVVQAAPEPVGFRLDLGFGKTTDWVPASEPGGQDTYRHIQQAYITARTRWGGADGTLDIGKFVTSAGAEVIETGDNWNYTRGLLFSWAIPYYHAGLRYTHPLPKSGAVGLQLLNGWNDVEDNNGAPSVGVTFTKPVGNGVTLTQNYIGGPEIADDNRHVRHLLDTIVSWQATERLAFLLNADYAREDRPTGAVSWKGAAAYARYALGDGRAVAARLEYFDDPDGAATGTEQTVREATLTYEWRPAAGLVTRAEIRHDRSDAPVFLSHGDGRRRTQTTVLLGSMYAF